MKKKRTNQLSDAISSFYRVSPSLQTLESTIHQVVTYRYLTDEFHS